MENRKRWKRKDLADQKAMLDARGADDEADPAGRLAAIEAARELFSGQSAKDFAASFCRAYEEREAERKRERALSLIGTPRRSRGNGGR